MMEFVLDNHESLTRLRTDRSLRRVIHRISIKTPGHERSHPLEARINKAYLACGCKSGAVAVYLALGSAGALWLADSSLIAWTWWKLAGIVFFAGLVGKFAGLALSHMRLIRSLNALSVEFNPN